MVQSNGGIRPVVIIQNDMGNKHSPTVIAAAITSQMGKSKLPTHIEIGPQNTKLKMTLSTVNNWLNCTIKSTKIIKHAFHWLPIKSN